MLAESLTLDLPIRAQPPRLSLTSKTKYAARRADGKYDYGWEVYDHEKKKSVRTKLGTATTYEEAEAAWANLKV